VINYRDIEKGTSCAQNAILTNEQAWRIQGNLYI